jgi:polysaccharide pyruvyl transferase WcaK-like protein
MRRALVINAYLLGNWGDTAITEGVISALREVGFDHIALAAMDWKSRGQGRGGLEPDEIVPPLLSLSDASPLMRRVRPLLLADVLARLARFRLQSADPLGAPYRRADAVVSVGGGFLGGERAGGNLIKLANIRAGAWAGRATIVAPVTVNPASPAVIRLLRWGLRDAMVFARDEATVDRLARIGTLATLVPDVALLAPSLRRAAGRPVDPVLHGVIGWAPRGYRRDHRAWGQPEAAEQVMVEAVRHLLATSGMRLRLVPHVRAAVGSDDDLEAVARVRQRLGDIDERRVEIAPDVTTLGESVDQFAGIDVLITSRMHAALFAAAHGTPAISVAYEPKVAGVMGDLGLADRVVPADETLTVARVVELVARLRSVDERRRTRQAFDAAQSRFEPYMQALRALAGGR